MPPLTERRPSTEERVSRIEGAQPNLAAKADVAQVETCITRQIAESEARITRQIIESEARIAKQLAEVRDEMAKFETRMVRWMLMSGAFGIVAITLMYKLFG